MTTLVGAAVVAVDVPVGTPLAGFAARTSGATGVHDPTTVRAVALDDVVLVTVDVCALHEDTCAQVRDAALGAGADACVTTATHTHSGPCVSFERLGPHDDATHERLVAAATRAVGEALAARRPCDLTWAQVHGTGVAKARRHPERVVDPPLQALHAAAADGSGHVATLVTYACHPVVLDATNSLVTADYPHALRAGVEHALPGTTCVFATGAAGDLNTGHRVVDSFRPTGDGRRTFAEAQRIGRLLADALATASWTPVAPAGPVRALDAPVPLDLAPLDEAGRPGPVTGTWPGRVTAVRVGDVALVALPGEPFLASAQAVQAARDGRPTFVLGYADGVPGYLPVREEYPHGGYEVHEAYRWYGMPDPFAPGGAEALVAAAHGLLERLDGV